MVLNNEEKALLSLLGTRGKIIQKHYDDLWNKCKAEGWFEGNRPLMDYMMWIDHEVSRNTAAIQREVLDLRKRLSEHKE